MATDADVVTPADTSAPSDAKLTSLSDVDSNHGVLDRAILNGSPGQDEIENKHIRSVEDQINSADVSVSGGSDTEASRGDSKSKDGSHLRASSVKKPATFKAVSVNKTFLAAKGGPASSPAVKAADKSNASSLSTTPTGASALSGSRPRLIAKTGSGAGTGPKFSSAINGAKGAAGPDAGAVWNKNRPVPPPEPKKFTDEELQKFGIHMASRLGPESSQGQNNWADIEDDDDWAPDTITWTDGTKVTLPSHEEQPPLALDPVPAATAPQAAPPVAAPAAPVPAPKEAARLVEKSRSPAPTETASPSTRPATLPSGKGMILKAGGSTEKPALVAKPPAATGPAKSPWAKLPPVDKASPADHLSGPHGHLPVRDNHMHSISPPPPTREIAADDFSRSTWREGPSAGNRELFNSHSGRYEPVGERRGSMRSDSRQRQPAVLQRPSQSDHPEPSPAFQTNRTQQEPPFGRRRGSSNVSGTGYPPRPSFGPHDLQPGMRRPSMTGSIESAHSPQLRHISPVDGQGPQRLHPGPQWQPRGSPSLTHASLHNPAAPPPAPVQQQVPEVPAAEDYEYQKKIMHEKRELAYQRRREEEARLEAEKQKRIQAKLAALGPAPERKSAKKEASNDETRGAVHIQQRQPSKDSDDSKQSKDAPSSAASGQAQAPAETEEATEAAGKAMRDAVPAQLRSRQDAKSTADQPDATANASQRNRQEPKSSWGPGAAAQPGRFTANWAPATQQTSSNVWAPNNARGLGNGTFNTNLGRGPLSPEAAAAQPAKGPAPIGPPSSQRQRSNAPAPAQPAPVSGRKESDLLRSRWSDAVISDDRAVTEQNIARKAEQERKLAERGLTLAEAMPEIKDNWRPHDPHPSLRNVPDLSRPAVPTGPGSAPILPTTSSTPQSRSRFFPTRDVRQEFAPTEPHRPQSPSPPPPDTVGHPAFDGDVRHPHVSLPRPQPVVRLPPSAAAAQGAPAARPAGNFSWSNPASVKDGAAAAVPTGPADHSRDWERQSRHAPHSSQDSTQSSAAWAERFQNLLSDRKQPLHRKGGAPPLHLVDASSRNALDQSNRHETATVSLPRTPTQPHHRLRTVAEDASLFFTATNSARKHFSAAPGAFMVKPVSEECFAAQEMGSLPAVNIPRDAPEAAWHPAAQPSTENKRNGIRTFKNADVTTVSQHWVPQDMSANGTPEYRIKFPGMTGAKTTPAPSLRTRSNPRRQNSNRPPRQSQGNPRGGKNSEANSQAGDAPPTRPHGRGGSRGSYRGRGSDWNRDSRRGPPAQATQ